MCRDHGRTVARVHFIWWISSWWPRTLKPSQLFWVVNLLTGCYCLYTCRRHLLLFSGPWRMEGWVDLGTAVKVCSRYPMLYIAVAVVINTTARVGISYTAVRHVKRWTRDREGRQWSKKADEWLSFGWIYDIIARYCVSQLKIACHLHGLLHWKTDKYKMFVSCVVMWTYLMHHSSCRP